MHQHKENDDIYFTYNVIDAPGLTDHLGRLKVCYALGCSLQYYYVHSAFKVSRSSSSNLDRFLGFDPFFQSTFEALDPNDY